MKRANRWMRTGAGLGIVALALPAAVDRYAEFALARSLAGAGLSASVSVSSYTGTVRLADVTLPGGQARIGAIRWQTPGTGWIGTAGAQSAGSFTMENIVADFGKGSLSIPKVSVEGATFGAGDWGRLFAFDAGLSARMRGLFAHAVVVPELSFKASVDAQNKIEYTLRAIRGEGLASGRFARITVDRTEFLTTAPGMTQDGIGKKSEIAGLDLAQLAHVWFDTAAADEKPRPVYDGYMLEGMSATTRGEVAMEMDFGRLSARALRLRPARTGSLATAVKDLMARAETAKQSGGKTDDRQVLGDVLPMISDLIDGYEDEGMSGEGLTITTRQNDGTPAVITFGKFAGSYGGGSVPAGFLVTDMALKSGDITARLAHFGIAGFSYAPTLKAMAELSAKGIFDYGSVDPRRFMPKIGEITIKGFSIDMPDPNAPAGVKPERISASLGRFVLSGRNEVQGIPTDIRLGIDNFAFKLPEMSSDAGIKTIRALGYQAVDLSASLAAGWDEKTREVRITDVAVSGANMGSVKLTGTLGNIGREVFEAEPALVQVALMGATAKALSLKVENTGLAEKLIAMQARQQGRKPEELRKEMGTLAALGIPALLGPSDDAKAISGAVARFLAKPRNLSIDVAAKNAGGIGIPDIATVGTPQAAMGLVSVKASASD